MKIELYTEEQKAAIRAVIIYLNNMTVDRCKFENGMGFNKDDMDDGEFLASIFVDPTMTSNCTYQDYDAAKAIIFKYHRQINQRDFILIFGKTYEEIHNLHIMKKMGLYG